MTPVHIVAEGITDARLLYQVLRHEGVSGVELFHPGGWQRAESLARSLLVAREGFVALVLDADGSLEERRAFLDESLWEVEPDRRRWQLFFFEPNLEAFVGEAAPSFVDRIPGRAGMSAQARIRAALREQPQLKLGAQELQRIAARSPISNLIAFIASARAQAA